MSVRMRATRRICGVARVVAVVASAMIYQNLHEMIDGQFIDITEIEDMPLVEA